MEWLDWGYIGLFMACFLGASVVPLSSEPVLMGLLAAGADPVLSLAIATVGNWLGGMTSYGIGRLGRWEWIERWFGASRQRVMGWKDHVDRFGPLLALLSWVPFLGDAATLALGFFRANVFTSALWMLVGRFLRYVAVVLLTDKVIGWF